VKISLASGGSGDILAAYYCCIKRGWPAAAYSLRRFAKALGIAVKDLF
jgi:hypothetical protein